MAFDAMLSRKTPHEPKHEQEKTQLKYLTQVLETIGSVQKGRVSEKHAEQSVGVSPFHKGTREFMAAMFQACRTGDELSSFFRHCCAVIDIMKMSDVIMYLVGLNPMVGRKISKHVSEVIRKDADMIEYRRTLKESARVKLLYQMQCKWYREMLHSKKCNRRYYSRTYCLCHRHLHPVW